MQFAFASVRNIRQPCVHKQKGMADHFALNTLLKETHQTHYIITRARYTKTNQSFAFFTPPRTVPHANG